MVTLAWALITIGAVSLLVVVTLVVRDLVRIFYSDRR